MRKTLVTMLTVVAVTLAAWATVSAQAGDSGNPTILKALADLQTSVNALATQVTNITTAVNNITTGLSTAPSVMATHNASKPAGYSAGCNVQNVGTSSVTVKAELFNIAGELLVDIPGGFTLAGGQGNGVFQNIGMGSIHAFVWCRFTMVSGSSANIRASLELVGSGLAPISIEAR